VLRSWLPAFSRFYNLKPSDFDEMTVGEAVVYFRDLQQILKGGDDGS
jgi:hypothetical protein